MSCKIIGVEKGTIADELGIKAGSEILSINKEKLRDYIDYRYAITAESLEIEIKEPDGNIKLYKIEKDYEDDLGIIFESAIFDEVRKCANNCIFCFIDQQPAGLRDSLYLKDDDYRLSYLQGTYITLTNLRKADRTRISLMKLGPLYVSVHTTNPELRIKMLKNKRAGELNKELDFLKENDIPIHCQIVLCPGFNDGKELERTLNDLWKYEEIVKSIAIVPVGITKYRKERIEPVTKEKAIETIEIAEKFNNDKKKNIASVSDEFFLLAGKKIPEKDYYNGYNQIEDGVGALRYLEDDFKKRIKRFKKIVKKRKELTIVSAMSSKNLFELIVKELNKIDNVNINLETIKSEYWGEGINVAGLITATDMIKQLKGNCYKHVMIPSNMLRSYTNEFLDGMNVKEVETAIDAKIHIVKDIYSTKELFDFIKS